jgi:voltage-gated potassium channel Kch
MQLGSRLQRSIGRAVQRRRIFPYLAVMTLALGLLSGFIVTLIDRESFPTFGTGVWWAIVTLATVGYGDVVPTGAWGRVVGSAVIVLGVTFLSFLTATVTSFFVGSQQQETKEAEQQARDERDAKLMASLAKLEERLASIEKKLGD